MTLSDFIITVFGLVFLGDMVLNVYAQVTRRKITRELLQEAGKTTTTMSEVLGKQFKGLADSIGRMEQNTRLSLQREGAIRCYAGIILHGIEQRLVMKAANTESEFKDAIFSEFPSAVMTAIAVLDIVPLKQPALIAKESPKTPPKVEDYIVNLEYARARWAQKPYQRGVLTQIINTIKNEYAKASD